MRPEILFPLFASLRTLRGVGPRYAAQIEKLAGPHVVDLLWHLPREIVDRRYRPTIAGAEPGRTATLRVHVTQHQPPPPDRKRLPYRVLCRDATGTITLVFFRGNKQYLEKTLPVDAVRIISGRVDFYDGRPQMPHPDYILSETEAAEMPDVEPLYPLATGLTPKVVFKAVRAALKAVRTLPEWLDPALVRQKDWPAWDAAILSAHNPSGTGSLLPEDKARERLAYDELLANQLALALMRHHAKQQAGRVLRGDGRLRQKVLSALPFSLTEWQQAALGEIDADMASGNRMLRLLQGDVGSGKTVVALLAMLNAVECGAQAALMAPTEILARQHFAAITPLAEQAGLRTALLTGRSKGMEREEILAGLADGTLPIVIGTHALFQEGVTFHDLGFVVVDEQHRFGVHQRLSLTAKGRSTDMLVMTATPIPRTLTLTAYGDLDVSRLSGKPPGRKPIRTVAISSDRLEEVIAGIGRQIDQGAKVYWVCPLVEESEVLDLSAAEDRHADLARRFGAGRVALIHGRMKGPEKDAAMARFASGPASILVATTVIEVGVDVPDATVMVIEQAERFGLAQLHQLRGRVGRGERASSCLLLRAPHLTDTARQRLKTLCATEDGFVIAEQDLKLRGAGEVLGTRQSGLPKTRLAELSLHGELLATAHDDARVILSRDPHLETERGRNLRTLLYLFERDAAVTNLRSG